MSDSEEEKKAVGADLEDDENVKLFDFGSKKKKKKKVGKNKVPQKVTETKEETGGADGTDESKLNYNVLTLS